MAQSTDVVVEKVGDRIHLYSDYFPGVAEMCKRVPGHNWAGKEETGGKYWTYPLTLTSCRALRHVFHDLLVIGPDLEKWARIEKDKEERLGALGKQAGASLMRVPEIAPKMAAAMKNRTYQQVGARFIAEGRQVCLFDEPGLGKTLQHLAGLMEAGEWHGQHLIVAPKAALKTVWYKQILQWTSPGFLKDDPTWYEGCEGDDIPAVFYMPDGRQKRLETLAMFEACPSKTKFLVINPAMLQIKMGNWCDKCHLWAQDVTKHNPCAICVAAEAGGEAVTVSDHVASWPDAHYSEPNHNMKRDVYKMDWPWLFLMKWDSVMVDEADQCLIGIRGPQKKTQTGEGFTALQYSGDNPIKVAATGTPMRGRIKNFWGIFHWTRPKQYTGTWAWAEHFLVVEDNGFGKRIGELREDREEEFYETMDGFVLRRTKREVQPEVPLKDYMEHWVEMTEKQKKQYMEFEAEGEAQLENGTIQGTGVLAEITRLRQFAYGVWDITGFGFEPTFDSPKLNLLMEMLKERGVTGNPDTEWRMEGGGHKYAVVSQFTQIINSIEQHMKEVGIETVKITGSVSTRQRDLAQESFNSPDGPRVVLLNTKAGGAAIELDQHCDETFILDETHVPDDQEQVEGRTNNRSGEIRQRIYHYIRTEGSIEQAIAEETNSKDLLAKTLLDGRRGVAFALRLLRRERNDD